ncbi:MAG: ABC transporter permease [Saprospiraceae bacterium]|nr:ABC transporter permease [Saprospiraceae bacterium]
MFRNTLQSFALAFQNIRSNLFHTFLSVLGIVIGVAALVATFSLIDGLEKLAREQISSNTSVNMLSVQTQTDKTINNIYVRKDTFQVLNYERFARFKASAPMLVNSMLSNRFNRELKVSGQDSTIGAVLVYVTESPKGDTALTHGHFFSATAFSAKEPVALINAGLAKLIAGSDDYNQTLGRTFSAFGSTVKVIGVVKDKRQEAPPTAYLPISLLSETDLHKSPPDMTLEVGKTEDVPVMKEQVKSWLKQEFGEGEKDFEVMTNEFWVDQTQKGFLIFRIVMGLIIGISVVVGGVGVMNVLLISVNERTQEIGLRKAVGARKGDIRRLFLAESITVAAFGSMVGLILGAGFAMAVIPIIRLFVEVPFQAVLTWNTFFVICVVAILVGIIFGTYPAVKAAKLDPVEALRHE